MVDNKTIADPTSHYGSPKAATRDFILQRVSGALSIVFTVFLIWLVVMLAGAHAEAIALIRNPFVAIMLILMLINTAVHMRIGMHEVVIDYFAGGRYRLTNTLNYWFAYGLAAIGVLCVLKIWIWG